MPAEALPGPVLVPQAGVERLVVASSELLLKSAVDRIGPLVLVALLW